MSVSGNLILENGESINYDNMDCFGFLTNIPRYLRENCRIKDSNSPLSTIVFDTEHLNKDIFEKVKEIPVFNIFEYSKNEVTINVSKYNADRVIFTLQFLRNLRGCSDNFSIITETYKPVVGFLLDFLIEESFSGDYYLAKEYDSDYSVYNCFMMNADDYKTLLEHDETNAHIFTNQGTFKEQAGYFKSHQFTGYNICKDLGVNIAKIRRHSQLWDSFSTVDKTLATIIESGHTIPDNYEKSVQEAPDNSMMLAWKKGDSKSVGFSGVVFNTHGGLEVVIDRFLKECGVDPKDYKV